VLLPAEFVRVAEETGLSGPLGEWVLREACRRLAAWRTTGDASDTFTMSINLSARQFALPRLPATVAAIVAEAGLQPRDIVLEVTETTMMDDLDATIEKLHELKRVGVALAIDDFGAGYSSLAHLKRFPVDALKVDRSFVAGLGIDAKDTLMVSGMISIAHALDLRVVAEGIETAEQRAHLLALDCDLGQGFFIHRPAPDGSAVAQVGDELPLAR
jgi:EAL domain-containing protein (putative c-di-GMP-specific phosphodiesterase class I)